MLWRDRWDHNCNWRPLLKLRLDCWLLFNFFRSWLFLGFYKLFILGRLIGILIFFAAKLMRFIFDSKEWLLWLIVFQSIGDVLFKHWMVHFGLFNMHLQWLYAAHVLYFALIRNTLNFPKFLLKFDLEFHLIILLGVFFQLSSLIYIHHDFNHGQLMFPLLKHLKVCTNFIACLFFLKTFFPFCVF